MLLVLISSICFYLTFCQLFFPHFYFLLKSNWRGKLISQYKYSPSNQNLDLMPEYILLTKAEHLQNWVPSSWIMEHNLAHISSNWLSVGTLLNKTFGDWSQKLLPCLESGVEISFRMEQLQMSQALSYNIHHITVLFIAA